MVICMPLLCKMVLTLAGPYIAGGGGGGGGLEGVAAPGRKTFFFF